MEFETTETAPSTSSRHEKSLGLLTIKFVSLLQEAKDGVLDLKVVSKTETTGFVGCFGGSIKWCFPLTTLIQQMRTKGCRSLRVQSGILIFLTGGLASRHYPDSSFILPLILKRVFFSSLKKFFFRVFVDRKLANHCISYALSIYRVFNAKSGLIELH